ncbi:unnamed protein product [Phytophthora fragariaefolia]|uniref:Unnamed protein product n=1 Tax=Phytophthora fragariaefolia TaxID=1490495 RepID=A0A9W6Y616_9STRA|nr:unnamed protein product [Phytophthora fragariaefolia]
MRFDPVRASLGHAEQPRSIPAQGTSQPPPEPAPPGRSVPGTSFDFRGPSPASSAGFAAAQSSGQARHNRHARANAAADDGNAPAANDILGPGNGSDGPNAATDRPNESQDPPQARRSTFLQRQDNEDLEPFVFSTEQYYGDFMTAMHEYSSEFTDMIFGNLGVDAQSWFREFKLSMDSRPITWQLFKERIRARVHVKLPEPPITAGHGTAEIVKRWFYQQQLLAETSAYISQNIPQTLEHNIKLVQRFKGAKPGAVKNPAKGHSKQKQQGSTTNRSQTGNRTSESNKFCVYCKRRNHTESECRTKARAEAKAGDSQINQRQSSVGWLPTELNPAGDGVNPLPAEPQPRGKRRQRGRARLAYHKGQLYCYLSPVAQIDDRKVHCFVDSGSSFNAISPNLDEKLNLTVGLRS